MLGNRSEGDRAVWSKTRLIIRMMSVSIVVLRFQQRLGVCAVSAGALQYCSTNFRSLSELADNRKSDHHHEGYS